LSDSELIADAASPPTGLVLALVGALIIGPLSLTIFIPALPDVQRDFGVDIQVVQMALSLPLLAILLAPTLAGSMSDRIGRRPVLLIIYAVLIVSCLVCLFAQSFWVLIIGRVIVGVTSTGAMIVARAILKDIFVQKNLSKAMARYSLAPVGAILLAPLLGGILTDVWGWRGVFAALSFLAIGIGLITMWKMPETHKHHASDRQQQKQLDGGFKALMLSSQFWCFTGQSVFHFAIAFALVAAAPHLMVDVLGRSATEYGLGMLLVAFGMFLGLMTVERVSSYWSIQTQVFIGCLFGAAASAVMPLMLTVGGFQLDPWVLFVPAALLGFGVGFVMPGSQAGIVSVVPSMSGTASGISSCLQMLLAAICTHIVAVPWERPGLALGVLGLIAMVGATFFALMPYIRRQRITPDAV
jgi:MFS transporter, DHA1 family, multidrug resistance protein